MEVSIHDMIIALEFHQKASEATKNGGSLFDLIVPLTGGKKLRDCTAGECLRVGEWMNSVGLRDGKWVYEIGEEAMKLAGLDTLDVGPHTLANPNIVEADRPRSQPKASFTRYIAGCWVALGEWEGISRC
jgi:hypothetical protein